MNDLLDTVKEGDLIPKTKHEFRSKAVTAFERTYKAIFEQAVEEVDRLGQTNQAINLLQEELLSPNRIEEMDTNQKIMLFELLTKSSQTNIQNLTKFATLFNDVRTVVGTFDGIAQFTGREHIRDK